MTRDTLLYWAHRSLGALPAILCVVVPDIALAQPGSSQAQGVATAQIVEPLSVVAQNDLSFGAVAVSAAQGGSVTIEPVTGAASYAGAARSACGAGGGCTRSAAVFLVKGEADRDYRIALPARVNARTTGGSGGELEVNALTSASRNRPGDGTSGALDRAGEDEVRVGGTLQIPAGTEPGNYAAEVPIVVSYG